MAGTVDMVQNIDCLKARMGEETGLGCPVSVLMKPQCGLADYVVRLLQLLSQFGTALSLSHKAVSEGN
jgi:hypothetical protein